MRKLFLLPLLLAGCAESGEPLLANAKCRTTLDVDTSPAHIAVRFVSAADPADQWVLNRWCETVGPAVYDPTPASESNHTGDSLFREPGGNIDSIAVVSWNVRVGGGDIMQFVGDLRAGRLTRGEPVEQFVLLLQETFRASVNLPAAVRIDVPDRIASMPPEGQRTGVVDAAERLGLALLYVPSMRNGVGTSGRMFEDRGNAILSTFPLEDPRAIELPFEAQRRVAASAVVHIDDSIPDIRVVSAHLDNKSRFTRIVASLGVGRLRQAMGLMRSVERDRPLIIGGDMNTWGPGWTEPAIPFMKGELPDSPQGTGQPTYIKPTFERRIDYIFADLPPGWRMHYRRVNYLYGSDHTPLLGWLVF